MGAEHPEQDRPSGAQEPVGGFFQSDNVWVLIPLAALSIPIIAVASDGPLVWALGAVAVVAALTFAVRYVMVLRHRLALEELAARQRLALAERDRYDAINRIVDDPLPRLGEQPRPEPQPRPGDPGPA
jgi:hypothetical protein